MPDFNPQLKVADDITPGNVQSLATKQLVSDSAQLGLIDDQQAAAYERFRTKPATLARNGNVDDAINAASIAMKFRNLAGSAAKIPDFIRRSTEATQASWLVWQDFVDRGKHPTENELLNKLGPRGYIKAAWRGKIEVTNDDLVKGAMGLELYNSFHGLKASPSSRWAANAVWLGTDAAAIGTGLALGGPIGGFFAAALTLPGHFSLDSMMRKRKKTGEDPAIRVTDYFGMAADMVIDPTFALSFTPPGAFSNPVTRKLIASTPVKMFGKPFKTILDSRMAGSLYAWLREPINVLPERISRPIVNSVINFQQELKNVTGPMLKDLFEGTPVTLASTRLAYKQFTTKKGVRAAAVGGLTPVTTNAAKFNRITSTTSSQFAAEIIGHKGAVPAGLAEFTVRGRRFVYNPAVAPANLQQDITDILARRAAHRDIGNDILLQQAMGWTDADINRALLLKNHSLGRINHAWASTIGLKPLPKTASGRVSKALSTNLPEWIRGGDFDQRVGMYISGKVGKSIFTKGELPWVREVERVIQQFRMDAGLPSGGLLRDLWPKLIGSDQYLPSDVVGNISIKTLKMLRLPKRSKIHSLGPLPREHFSGMSMLEDLGYMSGRAKHLNPILNRFSPDVVPFKTPVGRNIKKVTNPEWVGLTGAQQRYLEQTMLRISGRPKGPIHDAFDESFGNMFHWINDHMEPAISRRILRYYNARPNPTGKLGHFVRKGAIEVANFRLPEIDPMMKMTFMIQHNIIRAMLGGKVSTALANSAIVFNTAAAEGTPQMLKGIFRMHDRKWQKAIKEADLDIVWTQFNETNLWDKHIMGWLDDKMFKGFNFTEILGKGIAGQLAFERTMLKHVNPKTGRRFAGIDEWLLHATPDMRNNAMLAARWASIDQTHLYGMMGRAPAADSPFIRPFGTLLSFTTKQSEFLLRQMRRDPTGVIRYFALSGWLMNKLDDYIGADASPFVGLGFLPMTRSLDGLPIIASPEVQTFLDMTSAMGLLARDDPRGAVTKLRSAKVGLMNLMGLPVGATRDLAEAWEEWTVGSRPYGTEKFVESSKPEAIRRVAFSRSTIDRKRSELNTSIASSERKYDFEMDRRARLWVEAVTGMDSDRLNDASSMMLKPIIIDGQIIPIDQESMKARVKAKLQNTMVDADTQRWSDIPRALRFLYGDRVEAYERLKNREVR